MAQEQEDGHVKTSSPAPTSEPAVSADMPPPFHSSPDSFPIPHAPSSADLLSPSFPDNIRHASGPDTERLIFGGNRDSSAASPAPPHLSPLRSVRMSPHLPQVVNTAPIPSPSVLHRAQLVEDPQKHHLRHKFPRAQSSQLQSHHVDHLPPDQYSVPSARSAHINGTDHMSRSPSQASSPAVESVKLISSGTGTPDLVNQSYGHDGAYALRPALRPYPSVTSQSNEPSPPIPQSPRNVDINNMQAMRRFLLDRFGTYEFADYVLDFASNKTFPAHSLLLARSPGMQGMMHRARKDDNSQYWRLSIQPDAYFKHSDAFIDALRFLYCGELLDISRPLQAISPSEASSHDPQQEYPARMTYVLSYIAAGLTLDVSDIHMHGVHIAERMLRWDTLEILLDFTWKGPFTHTMAIQHLIRTALDFIIINFPYHFTLDTRMSNLHLQQSTPTPVILSEPRKIGHHRLKSIRFGDTPASHEVSLATSILSTILLVMPSEILCTIFRSVALKDKLGSDTVLHHMSTIVAEREQRRMDALRSYFPPGALTDRAYTTPPRLSWQEAVEPFNEDALGFRIVVRPVEDGLVGRR